jgi:tetratricopeptide (TPR) repeat protein
MKAQDLDWLRDASVNLLSMDMSRWTDIQVVPDKRVGDLLRELPGSTLTLTLNDGLTLARRAGAGMLVMGDFFRLGKGARIVANVFDVRTGAKLRSATREAGEPDSLLTAFTPLARGLLDVPPPAGARTGDLGTSSIDAYQEFLLGDRALNRFDLDGARKHLTRALELDSTFALAHLRMSYALAWGEQAIGQPESKLHALAAQRLGSRLPPRERALIAGEVAMSNADYGRACEAFAPLVARDSTDVEAMYMLGDCSYHDSYVRLWPTDTNRGTFRSSWNTSVRVLTRVLELDPNYHQAFEHILDILRSNQRIGCVNFEPGGTCDDATGIVLRDADTLLTVGIRGDTLPAWRADVTRAAKENPYLTNLAQAKRIAQLWVGADPSEGRAHAGLGRVLMSLGDLQGADAELKLASNRALAENLLTFRARMEVAAKLGRGAESRANFDSLVKAIPDAPGVYLTRGSLELMYGRVRRLRIWAGIAYGRLGPEAKTYGDAVPLVFLGVPPDDIGAREAAFFGSLTDAECSVACRRRRIEPTLAFAPRSARPSWDAYRLDANYNRYEFAARAHAMNDTAALRRAAILYDSLARRDYHSGWGDDALGVMSAEAFLSLRDTVAALKVVRFYVDSALAFQPLLPPDGGGAWWPRMMLLRADLAAATGSRNEAITWYDRVLDLWADADAELKPVLDRIRSARAALKP